MVDVEPNPVPIVRVTFTAPGSGVSGTFAGNVRTYTAASNAAGVVTTPVFTANTIAGSYSVTATSGMLSASFSLSNVAGGGGEHRGQCGERAQSAQIQTAFAQALQATVTDSYGNPGERGDGDVHWRLGTGRAGAFAGGANTAVTNAAGQATAGALKRRRTRPRRGSYVVTATVAGVGAAADFNLTNLVGAAGTISATGGTPQSTVVVLTSFGSALQTLVRDAGNNPVSGVTVTFAAPGSGASGTFASAAGRRRR